jgi:DNA-binding SARP family transcriptional activator
VWDARASETVSADTLIELLWGDDLPRNPANALQIQVSYLRKSLSSASTLGVQPIVTRPGGNALDVEPDAIDANRFERLVHELMSPERLRSEARAHAALERLDEALVLVAGRGPRRRRR